MLHKELRAAVTHRIRFLIWSLQQLGLSADLAQRIVRRQLIAPLSDIGYRCVPPVADLSEWVDASIKVRATSQILKSHLVMIEMTTPICACCKAILELLEYMKQHAGFFHYTATESRARCARVVKQKLITLHCDMSTRHAHLVPKTLRQEFLDSVELTFAYLFKAANARRICSVWRCCAPRSRVPVNFGLCHTHLLRAHMRNKVLP